MSWYYCYKLGYIDKEDGKIYPLGPFDSAGEWYDAFYRSSSYASDLHDEFLPIPDTMVSNELKNKCNYFNKDDYIRNLVSYLPLDELPTGDYIRKGYFLIDDIKQYEKDKYESEYFYDYMDPGEYARRLENELKFGKPEPQEDCEGNKYTVHSCADYSYYAYPKYCSKEYEAYLLREIADIYEYSDLVKNNKIVVILTQG